MRQPMYNKLMKAYALMRKIATSSQASSPTNENN